MIIRVRPLGIAAVKYCRTPVQMRYLEGDVPEENT